MACTNYRPDHNGECLNCDEDAGEHPRPHLKLATDTWRMIRAVSAVDPVGYEEAAAIVLIEMACDSAAEAARRKP